MLDKDAVLRMVKLYTNIRNEIGQDDYLELISGLDKNEVYEVMQILYENHITVTEDSIEKERSSYVYLNDNCNLTNEELCLIYQTGDESMLIALCKNNEKLVHKIAFRVMKEYNPESLTEEDLFAEGKQGLIKAAQMFKSDMGCKFSTYACWWIRQYITREVMNNGYFMRLPVHIFEKIIRINRVRKSLRNPTVSDIQLKLRANYGIDYSLEELRKLLMYADQYLKTSSLNKVIGQDDKDTEIIEFIPSTVNVEDEVMQTVMAEEIDKVLSTLTDRESTIIRMRYGIGNYDPMTLEDIGKIYHLTRERIRQIEVKTLRKLRNICKKNRLEDLLSA